MNEQPFQVWITQYALTRGIFSKMAVSSTCDESIIRVLHNTYCKPHWHTSEAEARQQAETMRQRKIKSLEKQIAKLEKLKF